EREDLGRWRRIARSLGSLGAPDLKSLLGEVVLDAARDVAGNFDTRVYTVASRVAPLGPSVVLRPNVVGNHSVGEILRGDALAERIQASGPVERIRHLAEIGTVVYVPTHLSNLDSPVFAYALESSQLPPVTYGAGKNLFTNPVLSFFMRNLGAY